MLNWPLRASRAIQKLFEPLQDIDVYVEDINDEVFYRTLLNAASGGKVHISRVVALGGRPNVIEAAKQHDHKIRRSLFIIDGDLPFTKGQPAPDVLGVHCHEAYCIENLLLCETAIANIISQELNIIHQEAMNRLQFTNWRNHITLPLAELFAAFATIHDADPTIPTISLPLDKICTEQKPKTPRTIDTTKIRALVSEILTQANTILGPVDSTRRYEAYKMRILSLANPLNAISGKNHLLPLLGLHLISMNCKVNKKSLRIRLSSIGDLSRFSALNDALYRAATGAFS